MVFILIPITSYAPPPDTGNITPGIETDSTLFEPNEANTKAAKTDKKMSLLDLIKKGGLVGYLIILLSIVSLGLILDYSFTTRRSSIIPSKDMDMLQDLIKNGSLEKLPKLDSPKASYLTMVTMAGLRESKQGYPSMLKAMEDSAELLANRIARKTEHLNVIGNISPMMGLLGTVIGMLRCFNEIAHTTGAIEPRQLAGGIFEALVTTCMGLVVAIPSLYCYALFRNRVDEFTGEASLAAESLLASFKPQQEGKQ